MRKPFQIHLFSYYKQFEYVWLILCIFILFQIIFGKEKKWKDKKKKKKKERKFVLK